MLTVNNQPFNTPERELAQDIALILGDPQNLDRYERYVHEYTASFLRSTLAEVLTYPQHKIKKSKVALFHFLVNKYGKQNKRHHRD